MEQDFMLGNRSKKKKKKLQTKLKSNDDYTFKLQSMTTAGVWLDGKSSRIASLGEWFEQQSQ